MIGFAITTFVTALSLFVVDLVVPGVTIATITAAILAAVSLGLVNGFVKPVLSILSLPATFLSLGAFSLVVNGFCFWLASLFVPGFMVNGFLGFILGPIALSFVSTFLSKYLAEKGLFTSLSGSDNVAINAGE